MTKDNKYNEINNWIWWSHISDYEEYGLLGFNAM
jgi:hypothetical protein